MSSLWHRVGADPGLIESVSAALDGRDDVLDLLWWAEHPGEPTPDGQPDPAAELESARRELYRAGSTGGDAAGVAAAAAERTALLERATAAARSAIAARAARAAPPGGTSSAAGAEGPVDDGDDAGRPTDSRRPLVLALLGAGAALVVGVAVGALAFGGADRGARTAVPALQVFDRAQRPGADVPLAPDAVPSSLEAASVRRLRAYSSVGTTLYGARARDGRVCAFVVVVAAASPPACITEAAFALGGLTLVVRATADPVDDSGRRPVDELDITWNPDDTVSITPLGVGSTTTRPGHA